MSRLRPAFAMGLVLALAGCGGSTPPPQPFPPLSWSYLTKLRLNAAKLVIDDSWVPTGEARHVEYEAPERPVDALRQMALDRLEMDGSAGEADYTVENASIIKVHDHYDADFAVKLVLRDANGNALGTITAEAKDSRTFISETPDAVQQDLYALVQKTMSDMNVDFEYEMRKNLAKYMFATKPVAPNPASVQSLGLGKPGSPSPQFPTEPTSPANGTAPTPLAPSLPANGEAPAPPVPPPTTTGPVPDASVPAGQTVIHNTLNPSLTPTGPAQPPLPAVPAGPLNIQTAPAKPATD